MTPDAGIPFDFDDGPRKNIDTDLVFKQIQPMTPEEIDNAERGYAAFMAQPASGIAPLEPTGASSSAAGAGRDEALGSTTVLSREPEYESAKHYDTAQASRPNAASADYDAPPDAALAHLMREAEQMRDAERLAQKSGAAMDALDAQAVGLAPAAAKPAGIEDPTNPAPADGKASGTAVAGKPSTPTDIEVAFAGMREKPGRQDRLVMSGDPEVRQLFLQELEAKGMIKVINGQRTVFGGDKKLAAIWKESADAVNKLRGSSGDAAISGERLGTAKFNTERNSLITKALSLVEGRSSGVMVLGAGTADSLKTQKTEYTSFMDKLSAQGLATKTGDGEYRSDAHLRDAVTAAAVVVGPYLRAKEEERANRFNKDKGDKPERDAAGSTSAAKEQPLTEKMEAQLRDPSQLLKKSKLAGESQPKSDGERTVGQVATLLKDGLRDVPPEGRVALLATVAGYIETVRESHKSAAPEDKKGLSYVAKALDDGKAQGTSVAQTFEAQLAKELAANPNFKAEFSAKLATMEQSGLVSAKSAASAQETLQTIDTNRVKDADAAASTTNAPATAGTGAVDTKALAAASGADLASKGVSASGGAYGADAAASTTSTPAAAGAGAVDTKALAAASGADLAPKGVSASGGAYGADAADSTTNAPATAGAGAVDTKALAAASGPDMASKGVSASGGAYGADAAASTTNAPAAAGAGAVDTKALAAATSADLAPKGVSASGGAYGADAAASSTSTPAAAGAGAVDTKALAAASGPDMASKGVSASGGAYGASAPGETLRDKVETLYQAGPHALTQEKATSLMADLEGRRGLPLERLDNGEGAKPTETLARLDKILATAASGKFDAATTVQASSLQLDMDRWKAQDSARPGGGLTQAAQSGADAGWEPQSKTAGAAADTQAKVAASVPAPSAERASAAPTTAPTAEAGRGRTDSGNTADPKSMPNPPASFSQTTAQVAKLSAAFSNPAGTFTTRSEKWNPAKITETATTLANLNTKEVERMEPGKLTEMAAFAGWLSQAANSGKIPGFAGEQGEALKQKIDKKAEELVGLAIDKGGPLTDTMQRSLTRSDALVTSMDTHQKLQEASREAPSKTTGSLLRDYDAPETPGRRDAPAADAKFEVPAASFAGASKSPAEVAQSAAKESLSIFDKGDISEPSVRNILKNATALTPENLQTLDKDTLAKTIVSLDVLAGNLRDGAVLGPVDQLSPATQKNLETLEKAVDTLTNTFGKSPDMAGALDKAHSALEAKFTSAASAGNENVDPIKAPTAAATPRGARGQER